MKVSEEVLGDLLPRTELRAAAFPAFGESALGVAAADNLGAALVVVHEVIISQ
jgi:hypothetical protein